MPITKKSATTWGFRLVRRLDSAGTNSAPHLGHFTPDSHSCSVAAMITAQFWHLKVDTIHFCWHQTAPALR
jgi:hypothetical protein